MSIQFKGKGPGSEVSAGEHQKGVCETLQTGLEL